MTFSESFVIFISLPPFFVRYSHCITTEEKMQQVIKEGGEDLAANIVYAIAFGLLAGGILSDCDFDCVMDYIMFIMALGLCLLNIVLCLL